MKTKIPKTLEWVFIVVLAGVLILQLVVLTAHRSNPNPLAENQEFQILKEEKLPMAKIHSIAEDDGRLYVFYAYAGLVNVYTLNGNYQYGIQVRFRAGGVGCLAFIDHKLYILSTADVIYCFDGMDLVQELEWDYEKAKNGDRTYSDLMNRIVDANSKETASGYRISSDGFTVEKPGTGNNQESFLPGNNSSAGLILTGIVCVFALILIFVRKKTQKQ